MGLLSFIKDAGQRLFGHKEVEKAAVESSPNLEELNNAAAEAIMKYIQSQNLTATDLSVSFDGASGYVNVAGAAPDQATKEKILLCCGNVAGVAGVDDNMTVESSEPEAQYYTVVSGDTLSKISKDYYGDPNKYNTIFEANRPMLTHPDKIYPGQMLRIPALA